MVGRRDSVEFMSERELVAAAQDRDQAAFGELMRRSRSIVHTICFRVCGNREDAREAAQDAMTRAWIGLPSFEGRSSFTTWLYRITVRVAVRHADRARRRTGLTDNEAVTPSGQRVAVEGTVESFERRIVDEALLGWALQQIEPGHRTALVLCDLAGLTYEEVAAVMGLPTTTIRSRIYRGRRALASVIRSTEGGPTHG